MRITQRRLADAAVLDIADEFVYGTRQEFTAALETAKQQGFRHLILNLSQVTFVDSAAIGLLALTMHQYNADNRTLSLVSPQGTVKQILELANIQKMIPVFPSEAAATSGRAA